MTAEMTMQHDQPEHNPNDPQVSGVLIPHARRHGREAITSREAELLHGFYDYCSEPDRGIDPYNVSPEASPAVAHAAHHYLHDVSQAFIAARAQRAPQAPRLFTMPEEPVSRRITMYYKEFGTSRRRKSPDLLALEEQYLAIRKGAFDLVTYGSSYTDESGIVTPRKRNGTRADAYPEIFLGRQLETALRRSGMQTAADSVEAALAAYGDRLLNLAGTGGVVAVERSTAAAPRVVSIDIENIPEEFRAENYRSRSD